MDAARTDNRSTGRAPERAADTAAFGRLTAAGHTASKVVLISGGSSGIGRATANYYADRGHRVYELSRSGSDRPGVRHLTADVCDPASVRRAVDKVMEEEGRLDILISNAGYGIGGSVEGTSPEDAAQQMRVNFEGGVHLVQAALPALRSGGGGRILFVSSLAAVIPIPFQAFYSASKAAVNTFALALANELRPFGIACALILPGDVRTGFTEHRVKGAAEAPAYANTASQSLAKMEADERGGRSPETIARRLYRMGTGRRSPALLRGASAADQALLIAYRLLPKRLSQRLLARLYA